MTLSVTGKVWVFGDNLNTDDMYPAFAMKISASALPIRPVKLRVLDVMHTSPGPTTPM